jgi:aspartyl-tRNA(Asn)/glutamyl-tRNA(Gln) amidotransferase subunit A
MAEIPLTVTEAARLLRAGSVTSVELTQAAIARADALDGSVGVYICRFDEQALRSAQRADAELAGGHDRGPLHGIPFGVKDIIACADGLTTAQSSILDPAWGGGKDAPVVRRLRTAGAVITGKTSTMEFACGLPDAAKPFPVPRNPWNLATWAGGSSSGTGSGVSVGMFHAGLGTDTAGSIRIPAAYCGVTGLMPTYGLVPKSGVVPLGYSIDRVGPLARSAQDCAAVLQAIAGFHPSDPASVDRGAPDFGQALTGDLAGMRLGVVRENHFPEGADPALAPRFDEAVAILTAAGASVVEITLPYWTEMIAADIVTMASEALAYHRADAHRWSEYAALTRTILARGALITGADYVQAQRVRRVAQLALAETFTDLDAILCPTIASGAPELEEVLGGDPAFADALFAQIFTPYWDAAGNPVLAAPMGFTADGLPLSFQIAGRPFDESTVLRIGAAYQSKTDYHLQLPQLVTEEVVP